MEISNHQLSGLWQRGSSLKVSAVIVHRVASLWVRIIGAIYGLDLLEYE
ncbi:MAG: hypothetical protein OFPII_07200 [Osedax symbiont Rs1]|nr:MAG: hypothetical protein OFPII_07200 [Osedax symbiont Rs1]